MKGRILIVALLATTLTSLPAAASDWPQFHHNARNTGHSPFPGTSFLDSAPALLWSYPTNATFGSPVVADIDDDGEREVLIVSHVGQILYCLSERGILEWTFQPDVGSFVSLPTTPAVADVDRDGTMEVLFKTHRAYTPRPRSTGSLYCLDHKGDVEWEFPLPMMWNLWTDGSPPTVAEVTADPGLEIVIQNSQFDYGKIFCVGSAGTLLWEYTYGYSTWPGISAPCVADLDDDGDAEIVATIETDYNAADVLCLDHRGNRLWRTGGINAGSSPVAVDLDRDRRTEVIIGTRDGLLLALDGSTGSPLASYDTGADAAIYDTPAVADTDLDGHTEIVFGANNGIVYCVDGHSFALDWAFATGDRVVSSPAIANIENPLGTKPGLETIFASFDGLLYVVDARGDLVWRYELGGRLVSSPAIADLGGDGRVAEIILGTEYDGTYVISARPTRHKVSAKAGQSNRRDVNRAAGRW